MSQAQASFTASASKYMISPGASNRGVEVVTGTVDLRDFETPSLVEDLEMFSLD